MLFHVAQVMLEHLSVTDTDFATPKGPLTSVHKDTEN